MFVEWVWPRRQIGTDEFKTFFLVQCNPDEAYEILAENRIAPYVFRKLLIRTQEVEKMYAQNGGQAMDSRELDYSVGFLVTSNVDIIESCEWADFYSPDATENSHFKRVAHFDIQKLSQLRAEARQLFIEKPLLADNLDKVRIPKRVEMAKLAAAGGLDRFVAGIPRAHREIMDSSDDDLALGIMLYSKLQGGHPGIENPPENIERLLTDLIDVFRARLQERTESTQPDLKKSYIFRAQDTSVIELFARRERAELNHDKLRTFVLQFTNSDQGNQREISQFLNKFTDDEVCEMLFYNWFFEPAGDITKELISCITSRINNL